MCYLKITHFLESAVRHKGRIRASNDLGTALSVAQLSGSISAVYMVLDALVVHRVIVPCKTYGWNTFALVR